MRWLDTQSSVLSPSYRLALPYTMFPMLTTASLALAAVLPAHAYVLTPTPTIPDLAARADVGGPLFPVSPQETYWTTDQDLPSPSPLADSTFRPHNQITALTHDYVTAPDGKLSMQAIYPAGSYTFSHDPQGGFSFYAPGPANVDLTTAKEATFSYDVYFPSGFQFVKGGKLPGLCTSSSPRLSHTALPRRGN